MTTENIWTKFEFNDSISKSAYDYLIEQSKGLEEATKGILTMNVEALDVVVDDLQPRPAALYMLYIVSRPMGFYRRKILSVIDEKLESKFPVDIMSHIDGYKIPKVDEDQFLQSIEEILSRTAVKNAIEELYKLSLNIEKDKQGS